MKLTELAKTIKELGRPKHGFSLLIYGAPKTGKTQLAATIAKVPQIRSVYLLDLENGHETLLTMLRKGILTQDEADKIQIIAIQDTPMRPLGMETIMRAITVNKPHVICNEHGKINCVQCVGPDKKPTGTVFDISKLTHDDVVIIDSGSALSTSILNYYTRPDQEGQPFKKAGWDEYGQQGRDLSNVLTVIQACRTNFIFITHELVNDGTMDVLNKRTGEIEVLTYEEHYPLIGTKNFSLNAAKYFSHVIYLSIDLQRHKGGSASTYKNRTITGSRGGWEIEKAPNLSLAAIFDQLYKQETTTETL